MSLFSLPPSTDPLCITLAITCGDGRCRVEVAEVSPAQHVLTVEVTDRPASAAFRKAIALVSEHLFTLQREAGR